MMKVIRRTVVGVLALTILAGMSSAEAIELLHQRKEYKSGDAFYDDIVAGEKRVPISTFARALKNQTAVHNAILTQTPTKAIATIQGILKRQPELLNEAAAHGLTPMHVASYFSHRAIVEELMRAAKRQETEEVIINTEDQIGLTPLHYAVRGISMVLVQYLIAKGANPNARNKTNQTVLGQAIEHNPKMALILLSQNADPEAPMWDGDLPISHAAYVGRYQVVKKLIDRRAKVNVTNSIGDTPLHLAIRFYSQEKASRGRVKRLLGDTTEMKNLKKTIKVLVTNGASLKVENNDGETPLDQRGIDLTEKEKQEMGIR